MYGTYEYVRTYRLDITFCTCIDIITILFLLLQIQDYSRIYTYERISFWDRVASFHIYPIVLEDEQKLILKYRNEGDNLSE